MKKFAIVELLEQAVISGSFRGLGSLSRLTVPEHSTRAIIPPIVNRNQASFDNDTGASEIVINTGIS